ncbi:MAG: sigma-70 family RNA polymerase sigma factor [Chloroflexi bacterium]|nr:sigma-70 family RNA polymerase sigma factor [Chloroflexota bacterium]
MSEDDAFVNAVTSLSDAVLLQQFVEGDEASFEALFHRHYDLVYGVLFRLTGTREEAEDLAQEVFLKLYDRPLRRAESLSGWLYRVATNTGYNALKAAQRRLKREQQGGEGLIQVDDLPEEEVTRRETRQRVQAVLARIPARSAKLLVLRQSGFSYQELAEIIGVAPSSIGTLLARAEEAFAATYQAMHEEK